MRCSSCGDEAVTFQEYSGKHLCRRHFCSNIEDKAKHAIRSHHWLKTGDHIGVTLSDDQKSRALLHLLHTLFSRRKDTRITAIIIDEGIYKPDHPNGAVRFAEARGVPVVRAPGDVSGITGEGTPGAEPALSGTPVIRSILLDALAREHGIAKIATSHSLDDEALSVLRSVMCGQPEEILAGSPDLPRRTLPVIHPFIEISDDDIFRYASLQGIECSPPPSPLPTGPMPADAAGFSSSLIPILDRYTRRHPATKYSLMHLGENIRGGGIDCGKILKTCSRFRITDEVNTHGA